MKGTTTRLNSAVVLCGLIMLLVTANLNWPQKYSGSVIEADAKGYYAWLPALFIYQDVHFGFFESVEKTYATPQTYFDYRLTCKGNTINKYPVGVAIMQAPFFLAAHLISIITNNKTDGYSYWYPVFISLAALVYMLAGLYMTGRFLRGLGLSDLTAGITIIVMLFATNLFYYTAGEPGMSHVYSFALSAAWLRLIQIWEEKRKGLLPAAVVTGLILLVRPMNLLLLAGFPLVFSSGKQLASSITTIRRNELIAACLIFLSILMIQPLLWFFQTGRFLIDTYPGEHFGPPHLFSFLLSFKKGAFVYTPVLFAALFGFRLLYARSAFRAIFLAVFLCLICIVLSSWNNWWYGGSFSSRVLVEYLPFFALPLANWIEQKKGRIYRLAILALLIILCQFQTYQYRYFIIHWEDMNRGKYFENFFDLP